MRSFRERNPVTVGLVGTVVLGLAVLAALSADNLPIIGGGIGYRAMFSEAGGIAPGDEVRVAGVKVGEVTGVELDGASVAVSFRVRDTWIGDRSTAAILVKTVLGGDYLSVDPEGDAALDPRTAISRQRTVAPYDLAQALGGLAATVGRIDTGQLAEGLRTLADALRGAPASARQALVGLQRLSATISSRDAGLARLLRNTTALSGVLASHDAEVQRLLADGDDLLSEVIARKSAIDTLLVATRSLAAELAGLVADDSAQLRPALAQLNGVVSMLERHQADLTTTLIRFAPYVRLLANTVGNGRWVDGYITNMLPPTVPGAVRPGR